MKEFIRNGSGYFCEKHVPVDMLMSCDILAVGHVQEPSFSSMKQILDRFLSNPCTFCETSCHC